MAVSAKQTAENYTSIAGFIVPGQLLVQQRSTSSASRHCNHVNVPLASPRKASSRSTAMFGRSNRSASLDACRWIRSTGRINAWITSRCRTQPSPSSELTSLWSWQNLRRVVRSRHGLRERASSSRTALLTCNVSPDRLEALRCVQSRDILDWDCER